MSTKKVEINIPESTYKELQKIADAASWSLEKVLVQSIQSGMPPTLSKVPEEFHADLLELNQLDDQDLLHIAEGRWQEPNNPDEMYKKANFAALKRTYALSLLKWRGHPVPTPFEF